MNLYLRIGLGVVAAVGIFFGIDHSIKSREIRERKMDEFDEDIQCDPDLLNRGQVPRDKLPGYEREIALEFRKREREITQPARDLRTVQDMFIQASNVMSSIVSVVEILCGVFNSFKKQQDTTVVNPYRPQQQQSPYVYNGCDYSYIKSNNSFNNNMNNNMMGGGVNNCNPSWNHPEEDRPCIMFV